MLHADGFGNALLDAAAADLDALGLGLGDAVSVNGEPGTFAATFADVAPGALLLYADSYGSPSLAVNRGSAMDALGLAIGGRVEIARVA